MINPGYAGMLKRDGAMAMPRSLADPNRQRRVERFATLLSLRSIPSGHPVRLPNPKGTDLPEYLGNPGTEPRSFQSIRSRGRVLDFPLCPWHSGWLQTR